MQRLRKKGTFRTDIRCFEPGKELNAKPLKAKKALLKKKASEVPDSPIFKKAKRQVLFKILLFADSYCMGVPRLLSSQRTRHGGHGPPPHVTDLLLPFRRVKIVFGL